MHPPNKTSIPLTHAGVFSPFVIYMSAAIFYIFYQYLLFALLGPIVASISLSLLSMSRFSLMLIF